MGEAGSLAMEPSRLMVLMMKCFSRVKLASPTLSELSMTNMMSSAPQRLSQSGEEPGLSGRGRDQLTFIDL